MSNMLFNNTGVLERGLDAAWKRNEVIANNIANIDTPGFKASKVLFESILADAMKGIGVKGKQTSPKHMETGTPSYDSIRHMVVQNRNFSMRMDGNNVDIDSEMVDMARNSILYNSLILKSSKELGRIKLAVQEGRK